MLRGVRWLAANAEIDQRGFFGAGGGLMEAFCEVMPSWQLRPWSPSVSKRIMLRVAAPVPIANHLGMLGAAQAAGRIMRGFGPELIYANSMQCAETLSHLADLDVPVLLHVHELDFWIRNYLPKRALERLVARVSHVIAVSNAVAENLVERCGFDSRKVSVIHGFIPALASDGELARAQRERFRAEAGCGPGDIVVGGCGARYPGKGIDLFIAAARQVAAAYPEVPIRFVWLGGDRGQSESARWVAHDIARAGLEGRVRFLDTRRDATEFFAAIDVFFLCSREDSFPLVCLEAADFGVPSVAFANAGGAPEFLRDDAGVVVPYLDVSAASAALGRLAVDESDRRQRGNAARARVRSEHSMEVGMQRVLRLMRSVAGKPAA